MMHHSSTTDTPAYAAAHPDAMPTRPDLTRPDLIPSVSNGRLWTNHCPALTTDRARGRSEGIGHGLIDALAASCRAGMSPLPPIRTLIPTEPEETP